MNKLYICIIIFKINSRLLRIVHIGSFVAHLSLNIKSLVANFKYLVSSAFTKFSQNSLWFLNVLDNIRFYIC